jgi:hypothetical protein
MPSCDDLQTLDATLQRMDDALDLLRTQRALVARRRNTILPVSRLPPELLATILLMACRKRVKCHNTDWIAEWCPTASDPSTAVELSHVSHAFRLVALATASLWSNIGASHVKTLAHQLVRRAGRMPLTVAIDIHPPWSLSDFMIEILREKRATIRHLWLPGGYSHDMDGLFQRLCYPAALESLHLELWGHRKSAPLQQYDLHRLVTLSLAGPGFLMPGPFTHPLLQLTKLALNLQFLEPEHVSRVLDFMLSTPALAELMISFGEPEPAWDALRDITPNVFSTSPIVICSLLERIKMTGSLACMLTLLYHLRPRAACHIDLSGDMAWLDHSGVLVRFLQGHPLGQGIVAALVGPAKIRGRSTGNYTPRARIPQMAAPSSSSRSTHCASQILPALLDGTTSGS